MMRRQADELVDAGEKKRVGRDQECGDAVLDNGLEDRVDLAIGAGPKEANLETNDVGPCFELARLARRGRKMRVDKYGDRLRPRRQLMQEAEPLGLKRDAQAGD